MTLGKPRIRGSSEILWHWFQVLSMNTILSKIWRTFSWEMFVDIDTHRRGMLCCLHLRCVSVAPKSCSQGQETPAVPSPPCSLDSWGRCRYQHCPGTPASRGLQWTSPPPLQGVWQHQPWLGAPASVWGLWWRPGGHGSCNRRIFLTCCRYHRAVSPSRAELNLIDHSSSSALLPVESAAPRYHQFSSQKTGSPSPTPAWNWSISGLWRIIIGTKRWWDGLRFHLWVTLHWLVSFLLKHQNVFKGCYYFHKWLLKKTNRKTLRNLSDSPPPGRNPRDLQLHFIELYTGGRSAGFKTWWLLRVTLAPERSCSQSSLTLDIDINVSEMFK